MDNADLYNMIMDKYYAASRTEQLEMIRPLITNQEVYLREANVKLIRAFGPAHPMIGYENVLLTNDKERSYGGSRMMLSNIFKDYDESGYILDDDEDVEWFVGYCQQCNLKIRAKHHAVRMPIEGGGWMGCYCCFKCIKDSINVENDVRTTLIDNFETIILATGIQDRIWPPKPKRSELVDIDNMRSFLEALREESGLPPIVEPIAMFGYTDMALSGLETNQPKKVCYSDGYDLPGSPKLIDYGPRSPPSSIMPAPRPIVMGYNPFASSTLPSLPMPDKQSGPGLLGQFGNGGF